ncbi:copper resistance protein NlpE [Candidatus Endomicrobiellum devescovinae]|jgi:hypothetical protein|uniref:copper resistance protein NlpE n=1 Tax=Candidatus Endomicrobiellum devescovinae TaxID=3242322 RepID=UPI00281703ED|nr:copper resistance protein NlpE N-terminal domain-containing protein [Endomicrobium sp.]
MKKKIILVLFPFIISGCLPLRQERKALKAIPIKEVELKNVELEAEQKQSLQFKECFGFFLKNNVKLPNNINFFTVNSTLKFKNLLGITKAMSNTVVVPNFSKSVLLIIAEKPSVNLRDISVNQIYMKEDNIYVEYEIKEQESDKNYFVQNLGIFEIEKPPVILNVYFVNKDNKAFVVPFGNRNDKSPLNVSDMLENYTGVYKGIFPAADNNKILTEMDLRPDCSYTLRQEYLTDNGRVFESSGKWYPSVDISSFVLNKNKDLIFYFINKNTIEKLDDTGERLESGSYILKK